MVRSLAASSRPKTQRVILDDSSHSSITGKLFNETVNVSSNCSLRSKETSIITPFYDNWVLPCTFAAKVTYCCTLQSLVHLNNRCIPDVLNDIVSHGLHDPEEFPFLEEMHILRRLQVSPSSLINC